jgi:hypothetical protein
MTLRNKTVSECNSRFAKISREVAAAFSFGEEQKAPVLVSNAKKDNSKGRISKRRNSIGIPPKIFTSLPSPADSFSGRRYPYVFSRSTDNIPLFDSWLKKIIENEILQPTIPLEQQWLSTKLGVAYSRGVASARSAAQSQVARLGILLPANSPFLNPAHIDRSRLIYTRTFNGIEGITTAMKDEMRKILADGRIRGRNP